MENTSILIVEDNPVAAEDLKNKLIRFGYGISAIAYSGQEALDSARHQRPDLALMDIRLGKGMSGIETASQLKHTYEIPVIFLSDHTDGDTVSRAKLTGPYGFIVKPFNDTELKTVLEIAVYKLQSDRQIKAHRQWLHTTLHSIGDGVIATDRREIISFMNPVAARLTGWDENEAVGQPMRNVFRIINEETRQAVESPVARVLRSGTVVGLANHTLLISRDEKEIPIADSGSPIKNEKGDITGVVLVFRDQSKERAAEKKLKESERRLSTLISNLPGIAYRCLPDDNWTMIYISEGCRTLTEYDPSELIASRLKAYGELIIPQDRDYVADAVQQAVEKEQFFTIEYRIRTKSGKLKWVWEKGLAINDGKTGKILLEGFINDITERKRIEEALTSSRERLQLILKGSNDAPWDWNLLDGDLYYSPQWWHQLGYTPDEMPADAALWRRLMHPADEAGVDAVFFDALESRNSFEIEFRLRHKDGHYVPVLSRAFITRNENGKPVRVTGTNMDLTDRKRFETAIIEQKKMAERYLDIAGVMFIALDIDGNVTMANKKACEILECGERDISGKNWFETFIPESSRGNVRNVFAKLLAGNIEPVEYYKNAVISKTGKEKYIAWHNTFITDSEGNVSGILSSGEDITEKKQLEDRLRQTQKMESIGTLAGGIAHDFNNILSSIIGFTELALTEVDNGTELEDDLQEVYAAGRRAKELVRQILTFARQSDERIKPIQVNAVAREVLKFIRSSIPTTIRIKDKIESRAYIMGSETQIHQVLMNLCTNAAHAMADTGGVLEVGLEDVTLNRVTTISRQVLRAGRYIRIKVSDTGVGMSSRMMDSIFEPYFTTKKPGEGTGMGLAVVHGIVESYGGKICVDSHPGIGTDFVIYLPVTHTRKGHRPYEQAELPGGHEAILFVDDEASIAKMGSRLIGQLGYSVTTLTSSLEALSLFRSAPETFDLVITDLTMPNLTGEKLALEMLKIRPDIPIILCTGYNKKISNAKAEEMGIKAFENKPFVKEDLAKTIRQVLDLGRGKNCSKDF